ncbi:hypothetical protein BT63DRAFT_416666 [Microthyrium microscopicum]|uniref:Uncharacterized protein n=1 Tax=Microthyrium microscopicum TaxID=703497 RepID=A0A6A6U2C6_9PEZI|nr:hypothetical protein BT63DRAFT_416666 [Microthyrium microscopicum]
MLKIVPGQEFEEGDPRKLFDELLLAAYYHNEHSNFDAAIMQVQANLQVPGLSTWYKCANMIIGLDSKAAWDEEADYWYHALRGAIARFDVEIKGKPEFTVLLDDLRDCLDDLTKQHPSFDEALAQQAYEDEKTSWDREEMAVLNEEFAERQREKAGAKAARTDLTEEEKNYKPKSLAERLGGSAVSEGHKPFKSPMKSKPDLDPPPKSPLPTRLVSNKNAVPKSPKTIGRTSKFETIDTLPAIYDTKPRKGRRELKKKKGDAIDIREMWHNDESGEKGKKDDETSADSEGTAEDR